MRILEEKRILEDNAKCGNDEESTKSYVDPNA